MPFVRPISCIRMMKAPILILPLIMLFKTGAILLLDAGTVLAVAGEKSPYFNPDFLQAIQILNEKAQTQVVANAGHAVMAEQPAAFNQILNRFAMSVQS